MPGLIIEATRSDFKQQVLEVSRTLPVLVDFWAPWCQPCTLLAPVLEQLAAEHADALRVVKVNTDQHSQLALDYNVRSLPTVKLFRDGQVVDEFSGLLPRAAVEGFLDRHLPRPSDRLCEQARATAAAHGMESALPLLREAHALDPGNPRVALQLLGALLDTGAVPDAEALFKSLPLNIQQDDAMAPLAARLNLARLLDGAPDESALMQAVAADQSDSNSRFLLGVRQVSRGDYESGLENLVHVVRTDRAFRNDGARCAMIDVFAILGNEGPIVRRFRSLLSSALN